MTFAFGSAGGGGRCPGCIGPGRWFAGRRKNLRKPQAPRRAPRVDAGTDQTAAAPQGGANSKNPGNAASRDVAEVGGGKQTRASPPTGQPAPRPAPEQRRNRAPAAGNSSRPHRPDRFCALRLCGRFQGLRFSRQVSLSKAMRVLPIVVKPAAHFRTKRPTWAANKEKLMGPRDVRGSCIYWCLQD